MLAHLDSLSKGIFNKGRNLKKFQIIKISKVVVQRLFFCLTTQMIIPQKNDKKKRKIPLTKNILPLFMYLVIYINS